MPSPPYQPNPNPPPPRSRSHCGRLSSLQAVGGPPAAGQPEATRPLSSSFSSPIITPLRLPTACWTFSSSEWESERVIRECWMKTSSKKSLASPPHSFIHQIETKHLSIVDFIGCWCVWTMIIPRRPIFPRSYGHVGIPISDGKKISSFPIRRSLLLPDRVISTLSFLLLLLLILLLIVALTNMAEEVYSQREVPRPADRQPAGPARASPLLLWLLLPSL